MVSLPQKTETVVISGQHSDGRARLGDFHKHAAPPFYSAPSMVSTHHNRRPPVVMYYCACPSTVLNEGCSLCFIHLSALEVVKAFGATGFMRSICSNGVNGVNDVNGIIGTCDASVTTYTNVYYGANGVAGVARIGVFVC